MSIRNVPCRAVLATLAVVAAGAAISASLTHAGKPNPPAAPPVQYTMTLVPALDEFSGMNNFGDMVDGRRLYDHATGLVHDLTAPIEACLGGGGLGFGDVLDINDTWQVAGTFTGLDARTHAFRCWLEISPDGSITATNFEQLTEPDGFPWSYGYAINNRGDVVGELDTDDAPPNLQWRAFLWPAAGGVEIIAPVFSQARDISDNGKVTGFMYPSGQQHAFLYDPASGVKDLGVLPRGTVSFGNAVNDKGQVVGYSYGSRPAHAFRYTPGVGMADLGTLPLDYRSSAASINAGGDVVGISSDRNWVDHAYVYTDANKMLKLSTLILDPPAGLDPNSLRPEAVNDCGQIAGTATVSGVFGVVLLTPVPVP